jgi:hypothetical protein
MTYYVAVLALVAMLAAALAGQLALALAAGALWLLLTLELCGRRLAGTSHRPAHVAEMIATSVAIPIAAVYWRLAGALRFRAPFA